MPEPPKTVEEIVARRRAQNRPTNIFVEGSGGHFRDDLDDTVQKIARIIAGDAGEVLENDFDDIGSDDVVVIDLTVNNLREKSGHRRQHQEIANLSHASFAGSVVYTSTSNGRLFGAAEPVK